MTQITALAARLPIRLLGLHDGIFGASPAAPRRLPAGEPATGAAA